MSHFLTFFRVWRGACIIAARVCLYSHVSRVHMALWRRARSPCCQHMASETVKLQTAAFCGPEGRHLIRMCSCRNLTHRAGAFKQHLGRKVFLRKVFKCNPPKNKGSLLLTWFHVPEGKLGIMNGTMTSVGNNPPSKEPFTTFVASQRR